MFVILALMVGGAAATVGFVRASRAEQEARQEAETAKQVSDFLVKLFESPSRRRLEVPLLQQGRFLTEVRSELNRSSRTNLSSKRA